MADIEWAEPAPPRAGRRGTVFSEEILAILRANPGRWALIKRDHTNAEVAQRHRAQHPDFETTVRGTPGHYDIYARYVGGGEGPS